MFTVDWFKDSPFEKKKIWPMTVGTDENSHSIFIDGNETTAPSPMDLVLLGTVACIQHYIIIILKRMRKNVEAVRGEIELLQEKKDPKVFTFVKINFLIKGNVEEKDVERAITLTKGKYCPASIMLERGGTKFKISYKIVR